MISALLLSFLYTEIPPHLLLPHHLATLYVCSSVNYLHYVCLPLSPSNPLSLDMIAMASIHIPALLNPVTSQVFPLPSGLDSFSPYCVISPSHKLFVFPPSANQVTQLLLHSARADVSRLLFVWIL